MKDTKLDNGMLSIHKPSMNNLGAILNDVVRRIGYILSGPLIFITNKPSDIK